MFEGFSYLVASLLLIGAVVFFTGTEIAGLKPTFGKGKPVPPRNLRMIAGAVFVLLAGGAFWVAANTSAVLRYLTMG